MQESQWDPLSRNQVRLFWGGIIFTLLVMLFLPFGYFMLSPMIGVFLVVFPMTRIHGVFLLINTALFWGLAITAATLGGLPESSLNFDFVWGWSMFLVYYLKPFFTLAVTYNILFLLPLVFMELVYWVVMHQRWKPVAAFTVALVLFAQLGYGYAEQCAKKFEALEPRQGEVLSQAELLEQIGSPVYYRGKHELGFYVKDHKMICVKFLPDGLCEVREGQGYFLD